MFLIFWNWRFGEILLLKTSTRFVRCRYVYNTLMQRSARCWYNLDTLKPQSHCRPKRPRPLRPREFCFDAKDALLGKVVMENKCVKKCSRPLRQNLGIMTPTPTCNVWRIVGVEWTCDHYVRRTSITSDARPLRLVLRGIRPVYVWRSSYSRPDAVVNQ